MKAGVRSPPTLEPLTEATAASPPAPGPLAQGAPGWQAHLVVALAYGAAALLSIYLSRQPGNIASIWFANAVGVAALLQLPATRWPALITTLAASIVACNLAWGDTLLAALAFVPANLVEVLGGAWLLRRQGQPQAGLRSPELLLRLLFFGAFLPQLAGTVLGALTIDWLGHAPASRVWLRWLEGTVIGAVSVLPLACLLFGQPWARTRQHLLDWRLLVLAPLAAAITLLSLAHLPFPFIYLALPLLMAAMMLELVAVAALTALQSVVMAAAIDFGIFVPPPITAEWMQLYIYLAYAAALVPAQLLAAALADMRDSHERLAERTRELHRVNEGLQSFVHIVSHDLREPLNTITQFSSLVQQDHGTLLPPQGRQYLSLVNQGATRMRSLLDAVLQYARLPGPQGLPRQRVDMNMVMANVQQAVAGRLRETAGELDVAALPAVHGHEALLSLMMQNLVANGLKFTPPGRVPRVRVAASVHLGQVRIEVEDNGIGVAPEDRDKLFKPFQRLNPRRLFEGHGLGLALCRLVAEAHGGYIELADSEPGRGSCFIVTLPLAAGEPATPV